MNAFSSSSRRFARMRLEIKPNAIKKRWQWSAELILVALEIPHRVSRAQTLRTTTQLRRLQCSRIQLVMDKAQVVFPRWRMAQHLLLHQEKLTSQLRWWAATPLCQMEVVCSGQRTLQWQRHLEEERGQLAMVVDLHARPCNLVKLRSCPTTSTLSEILYYIKQAL